MPKKQIERRWVLAAPPRHDDKPSIEVRHGYLVSGDAEMVVRRAGSSCTLAIKRDGAAWESAMPEWAFNAIWPSTRGHRLRKKRYTLREGRNDLSLDVFEGKLEGLIMLSCEFRSAASAEKFSLPEWGAGAIEVTDDRRFGSEALASKGLKGLRRRLLGAESVDEPVRAGANDGGSRDREDPGPDDLTGDSPANS